MSTGCSNNFIRDIFHPVAREVYQTFKDNGYVLNPTGPYLLDFDIAQKVTMTRAVVYLKRSKMTGKIEKTGYTRRLVERIARDIEGRKIGGHNDDEKDDDEWSINDESFHDNEDDESISDNGDDESSCNDEDFDWIPIIQLDRLSAEMDTFLQVQFRKMTQALCDAPSTPWQMKKLLEMLTCVDDGGQQLSFKKPMVNRIVECGSQLFHNLSVPAEAFMLDEQKYNLREEKVEAATRILVEAIRNLLDTSVEITVECVTGWATAYDTEDGLTLNTTKTMMQYILGRLVDLKKTDTIPYPNIPNPTSAAEGFSDNYSKEDIQDGLGRLDSFIEKTVPNSILLLDKNGTLFGHRPRALHKRAEKQYNYRTVTSVMDGEIILLAHNAERKIALLHGPPGRSMDSRGNEISVKESVRRGNEMEVLKRVVVEFQSASDRTLPPAKGDAIFGSYMFEYIVRALRAGKRAAAATFRHVITPPTVNALKQNRLQKTPLDPDHPVADNQRRAIAAAKTSSAPVARPQNPILMIRAKGILSNIMDARDMAQVEAAWDKAVSILEEDNPKTDALDKRIKLVINGIQPTSQLHKALLSIQSAKPKANSGNANGHGFITIERYYKEEQYDAILALGTNTPFWVYHSNGTGDSIPEDCSVHLGHPIINEWTKEGLVGRLKGKSVATRKNNTAVDKVSSKTKNVKLSIQSVLHNNCSRFMGEMGKQSFILCQLVKVQAVTIQQAKVPQGKEAQMATVMMLQVGVRFWTRFNNKTDPSVLPTDITNHLIFNEIAWIGIRDRLQKEALRLKKTIRKEMKGNRPVKSACGKWILMYLVDIPIS